VTVDTLLIEAPEATNLQIRIVPGGGVEICYTTPDGAEHTIDVFPTVANASPTMQDVLDLIGPVLGCRLEHEVSTHGTATDLDDITAAPDAPCAPMRPALEFKR